MRLFYIDCLGVWDEKIQDKRYQLMKTEQLPMPPYHPQSSICHNFEHLLTK